MTVTDSKAHWLLWSLYTIECCCFLANFCLYFSLYYCKLCYIKLLFLFFFFCTIKNCQILLKNLNFVAGMTRRFVSTKRLIRYFSNSSKLVEHRAQTVPFAKSRCFLAYTVKNNKLQLISKNLINPS